MKSTRNLPRRNRDDPSGQTESRIARDLNREKALETIRRLARPFPPGLDLTVKRQMGVKPFLDTSPQVSVKTSPIAKATVFVFLLSCTCALCQFAATDWAKADHAVVRLLPSHFPQLPVAIRQELTRRSCTIPQVWGDRKPSNVVQGMFIRQGELDWAVLCSVNRVSSILVFRNTSPIVFADLASQPDLNFLQGEGGDQIGYSRGLAAGRDSTHRPSRNRRCLCRQGLHNSVFRWR